MAELSTRETHQLARRLYLIQVLLNYRTMQGGGYLFALWPWIRSHPRREENAHNAAGYLNSHPVFASFAVGAMRRRMEDITADASGVAHEPPDDFAQWRESLAGPLGVTGDSLIWDRWKPLIFAAGAWMLLFAPSIFTWVVVAAACLLLYNVPLYRLRVWGVKTGYRLGSRVLDAMRDERFGRWRKRLTLAGAMLAGALAGTAIHRSAQGEVGRGVQFWVALMLMLLCLRFRFSAATAAAIAIVGTLVFPGLP